MTTSEPGGDWTIISVHLPGVEAKALLMHLRLVGWRETDYCEMTYPAVEGATVGYGPALPPGATSEEILQAVAPGRAQRWHESDHGTLRSPCWCCCERCNPDVDPQAAEPSRPNPYWEDAWRGLERRLRDSAGEQPPGGAGTRGGGGVADPDPGPR